MGSSLQEHIDFDRRVELRGRTSARAKEVLIVGDGAVGQVYAKALQQAGDRVSFWTREARRASLAEGVTMYAIDGKRRRPERLVPAATYASLADLGEQRFDEVWLCISTPALERAIEAPETPLGQLLRNLHGAILVVLQTAVHLPALLDPIVPAERRCTGGIAMISYAAPLVEGEVPESGVAYWVPAPSPFEGAGAESIVARLKAGGCPAAVAEDTRFTMAIGSATLMPIIAALEAADWSFKTFRGPWSKTAAGAVQEARAVTAGQLGKTAPMSGALIRPTTLRLATLAAPTVLPLEIETYLRYHFTKVREQTKRNIARYIAGGKDAAIPTPNLDAIWQAVFA